MNEHTLIDQITDIRAELEAARAAAYQYANGFHEGGEGYNPYQRAIATLEAKEDAALEAQAAAAYAARLAAEDAEWTCEVTRTRRAAWNAWVRTQGRSIAPATVVAHCQAVGHDMVLLARQVKRHGL